tara:strand:- start:1610 stop:4429 length:2820 start_codon:yes stop_codon:yes gene_type:complete
MAEEEKYNTRIEAIMAYLRSFLDDKEEPKKTGLKKGEKSLAEQINFGGKFEKVKRKAEGGSIEKEPKDTGKRTPEGRIIWNDGVEDYSEKTTTFEIDGKWYTMPTVAEDGSQYSEEQIKEYVKTLLEAGYAPTDFLTGEELPEFRYKEDAEEYAASRSDTRKQEESSMDEQMKMFGEGGLLDEGGEVDEESGNEVPIGGTKEGVRDDIPAMLSEGEFVFPEDVTRYHGLEKLMTLRQEAKMGLKKMEAMGQMGNSEEATIPDDLPFTMDDLLVVVTGEEEEPKKKDDEPIKAQAGTFVPANQQLNNMGVMGFQESMYGQQGLQNPTATVMPQPPASSVAPTVQAPPVGGYTAPTVLAEPVQQTDFVPETSDVYKPVKYINPTTGETMMINEYQGNPVSAVPAGFIRYDDYIAQGGKDPDETTVSGTGTGVESTSVQTAQLAGAQDDETKAKAANLQKMRDDAERERIQEYNKVFDLDNIKISDPNDENFISNEQLIDAYKDQIQAENVAMGMTPLIPFAGLLPRLGRGKVNNALDARFGKAAGYDDFRENPEFKKLTEDVTRGSVLKEAGSKIAKDFAEGLTKEGLGFGDLSNPENFYNKYKPKYSVETFNSLDGMTKKRAGESFGITSTGQITGHLTVREQQQFDNAIRDGNSSTANHFSLVANSRAKKDQFAKKYASEIKDIQKMPEGAAKEKAIKDLHSTGSAMGSTFLSLSSVEEAVKYGSSQHTAVAQGAAKPSKGFGKQPEVVNNDPNRSSSSSSTSVSSGRSKADIQKEINAKIKAATTYDEFGDKKVDWNKANVGSLVKERDSGGGGGGGSSPKPAEAAGGACCFIMLEARYGDGTMDEVVRRYRDEHMTDRNRRGYYKVAEVFVPLMRKSRMFKWLVTKTFADPLVAYGKYYYGQNKYGVIYSPVKNFWMKVFDTVGGDVEFIRENGETV